MWVSPLSGQAVGRGEGGTRGLAGRQCLVTRGGVLLLGNMLVESKRASK